MALLTQEQFKKVRPGGNYSTYLQFVAKKRGVSVSELKKTAKFGVGEKRYEKLVKNARATSAGGGGRPGQGQRFEPWQIRKASRDLKKVLKGTPLEKQIPLFMVAAELSGFNPRFLAALAALESAYGRSTPGNAPYNYWGWSVNTGQQSSDVSDPFQNPQSAFRYFGKAFGKNYKGSNLFTDFAPYAADPGWESKVASIMRRMGGNPYDVRFGPAL